VSSIEREFSDRATLVGISLPDFIESVFALKSAQAGAVATNGATNKVVQHPPPLEQPSQSPQHPPATLLDGPPAVEEEENEQGITDGGGSDGDNSGGEHVVAAVDYRTAGDAGVASKGDDYRSVDGAEMAAGEPTTEPDVIVAEVEKDVKRVRIQVTEDKGDSAEERARREDGSEGRDGADAEQDGFHTEKDRPVGEGLLRSSHLSKGPMSTGASIVSSIASSGRVIRNKIGHWFGVMPDDYDGAPPAEYPGAAAARAADMGSVGAEHAEPPTQRAPMSPARAKLEHAGLEVFDMFNPATEQAKNLPTSLYGEVLGESGEAPLVTDYHAALSAYRRYIAKEKVFKRKRMHRQLTDETDCSRSTDASAPKRKGALNDDVKMQLRSLPTFTPRFIPAMTFVQLVVVCAMLFDSYSTKDFARIGLSSTQHTCSVDPNGAPTCPLNFKGLQDVTAVQVRAPFAAPFSHSKRSPSPQHCNVSLRCCLLTTLERSIFN
jgi:hypothetical protein